MHQPAWSLFGRDQARGIDPCSPRLPRSCPHLPDDDLRLPLPARGWPTPARLARLRAVRQRDPANMLVAVPPGAARGLWSLANGRRVACRSSTGSSSSTCRRRGHCRTAWSPPRRRVAARRRPHDPLPPASVRRATARSTGADLPCAAPAAGPSSPPSNLRRFPRRTCTCGSSEPRERGPASRRSAFITRARGSAWPAWPGSSPPALTARPRGRPRGADLIYLYAPRTTAPARRRPPEPSSLGAPTSTARHRRLRTSPPQNV